MKQIPCFSVKDGSCPDSGFTVYLEPGGPVLNFCLRVEGDNVHKIRFDLHKEDAVELAFAILKEYADVSTR